MRRLTFSRTGTFHFETVRTLWSSPFDGADYGEVATAVAGVRPGDVESWYRRWWELARATHGRAERLADQVSRGKALLRAGNYARTAEFYLDPHDPRRTATALATREWFDAGLAALGVAATRTRLPYRDGELDTIFLRSARPDAAPELPVLVVHGGFDSTIEELYFTIGAGAVERGYHVLIFEGPGQGTALREFGLPFTPDWHEPAGLAIDSLAGHGVSGPIVGVGVSMGGHLLARAAAVDKRYDGIVLFDYFPGLPEAFAHNAPRFARGSMAGMPWWLRSLVTLYARFDVNLAWVLRNAHWTFGTSTLPDLMRELGRYTEGPWVSEVEADALVLVGEDEHFFDHRLAAGFARRLTSARSVTVHEFPSAEGGGLHCQAGAVHLAHEVIFDWVGRRWTAPVEARLDRASV